MKALTILQPWASALMTGQKCYETRSWATSYRGPLAIHAGKGVRVPEAKTLPRGVLLGYGELIACHPVESLSDILDEQERSWGNFALGRFAWEIVNLTPLQTPIPASGQLGLWACPLL